tara:strand:- start:60098 stop:60550 length:453 start_codon:yes stop_codon:yes gene_type:complete
MKRLVVASFVALAAAIFVSDTASAQYGFGYPLPGYGVGLPYARIGGSTRTPPYFAVHPPVYYGARHARPYGISPFPAPSVVNAPDGYNGEPAARFYYPPKAPIAPLAPMCNPYIIGKLDAAPKAKPPQDFVVGKVKSNPFVEPTDRLAKN